MTIRRWVVVSMLLLLGGVAWANVRLVQLAFETEPDCVPHVRVGITGDSYRAAKSSC